MDKTELSHAVEKEKMVLPIPLAPSTSRPTGGNPRQTTAPQAGEVKIEETKIDALDAIAAFNARNGPPKQKPKREEVSLFNNKNAPVIPSPEPAKFAGGAYDKTPGPRPKIQKQDKFNKESEDFKKDPWAKREPTSFLLFDSPEQEQFEINKQRKQHDRTVQERRKNQNIADRTRSHNPVVKKQLEKVTAEGGTASNKDVEPLLLPVVTQTEDPVDIQIGDFDEPETKEIGLNFIMPTTILVETQPFLPSLWKVTTVGIFLKKAWSLFTQTCCSGDWINSMFSFEATIVMFAAKWMLLYYSFFQTYYLQPQINVYLIKNMMEQSVIKRHEKNRLTQQTTKGFITYDYEARINFPTKHWVIKKVFSLINGISKAIQWIGDTTPTGPFAGFYKHSKFRPWEYIKLPPILRNQETTKFYELDRGSLKPKTLTVNVDLMQRIMTTKALNFHQPIETQMKTLTALINNQSDVNFSDIEFERSTVSDTLTLAKFQLLNQTSLVAEMGFERASNQLRQNLDIDTTRLNPVGGHHFHPNRKKILEYDPPETFQRGLIASVLFSAISVSLLGVLAYHTLTLPTQLVPYLERLKDLPSRLLSYKVVLPEWVEGSYTKDVFPLLAGPVQILGPIATTSDGSLLLRIRYVTNWRSVNPVIVAFYVIKDFLTTTGQIIFQPFQKLFRILTSPLYETGDREEFL
jgi:hypothetical protein